MFRLRQVDSTDFRNRHNRGKNSVKMSSKGVKRTKTVGASRGKQKNKLAVGSILRAVFKVSVTAGSVVALGFAISALDLQKKWQNFYQKPIKQIQITGDFLYLSQSELQKIIQPAINQNFFEIDLEKIKQEVAKNPWVDAITVTKKWPDKLLVTVTEQQPIARWGQAGFLNMRGDIIRVEDNLSLASLPLLSGDDKYAAEVMQQYLRLGKALAQAEMSLEAVELDNTRAWTLTVDGDKVIRLGREDTWERLQYLTAARKTVLANKFDKVAGVDLRYHNGLAVRWKDPVKQRAVAQN